jgi:pilus assembly protein TadC
MGNFSIAELERDKFMGPIIRNLKSFSGFLLTLAIGMIALMWILNYVGSKGWGPLSQGANVAKGLVSGSSGGTVNVAPSMAPPVQSNGYSF